MEEIRIERKRKGQPRGGKEGPRSPYAVAMTRMEPGQSFTAPLKYRARLGVMATWWGRKLGRTFSVQKETTLVLRVWRLA